MRLFDLLQETHAALSANKIRSGLTALGIVIGIASVIAMTAVGQGAQEVIRSNIEAIGSNLLIVMPGAQRGSVSAGRGSAKSLTLADATALASTLTSIQDVAPSVRVRAQVVAGGANTNTDANGVTRAYATVRNIDMEQGSFITDEDDLSKARVTVLGPVTRDDVFGPGADVVGSTIHMKNIEFKVIGVTKPKGGNGFGNQDDELFIPLSTALHYITGDTSLSTISISAQDAASMANVKQQITDVLISRHHITDPARADFNVLNQTDLVATASSVASTLTNLLAAIAGISLVVGGVGIMNMMLSTVTERKREIGLRKAIGSKRREITHQFLVEAITLTFLGGAIGLLVGCLISFGISYFAGLITKVSLTSIILAFGVSGAIGIFFGYYPALKASKLSPIDALRSE